MCVAATTEKKHAPAGLRMCTRQWVHGARRTERIVCWRDTLAQVAAAVVGAVVLDLEVRDTVLQFVRERVVDGVHAAKRCITPCGRHFESVEHARLWRHVEIRHISVPYRFAIAEAAERLAAHLAGGPNGGFRQAFDETTTVLLDRRPVEIAKAVADCD